MENSPLLSPVEFRDTARETQLLLRVLNAADGDLNADELAGASLRAILGAIAFDLAFFLLIDPESPSLTLSHPVHVPEALARAILSIAVPSGFHGQAADPDQDALALSHLADELGPLLAVHGYAQTIAIPLLAAHRGLGVLTLARRERDGIDYLPFANKDFLEAIGTSIGSAMQRARDAERLRASEEKHRFKYQTIARDVTERVVAEGELKRRVSEMEAIASVGELIAQSADPEEPLREIANEIRAILQADSVSFQLREGDSMRLVLSSIEESSLVPLLNYHRLILAGLEPRIVPDCNAADVDEGQRTTLVRLGFVSSVGVRLFAQGVALGILFVNQRTPRQWTPDEVRLISTFARQVAGAMRNIKLLRETQARVHELEGVAEMSMFAASMIGEDRLVERAVELTKELLGVDMVAVHLLDDQQFRPPRMWGTDRLQAEPLRMTPVLLEFLESLKPFVFDRNRPLPPIPQAVQRVTLQSAQAAIATPLASATGVLGIFTATRRDNHVWTPDEVRSVQTIANQLATGISNARLFDSLQRERGELEATWNSVFSGLFTTDERGIIRTWNRAAAEITGFPAEAIYGKNWTEIAHIREDKPDILIFEAMAGGDVAFGMAPRTLTTADGRVIPLREAAAPLRDQMGKVRGAVGAFWDQTREQAAERAKLDFLHEVSHELRNSLTAVLSMATMLRDQKPRGATRAGAIRVLSEQVDRLKAFSVRFLQFEQEQFVQPLQEESIDIGHELERFVTSARMEHPGHEFRLFGQAGVGHADRARLETVMMNIIENAAKFSPPGSPISITAKPIPGGRIGISIRNEGPGISEQELCHIFERGYRARLEGDDRLVDGTGIGLWLAETKMHEMGGDICVDSDGNKGVTFTLTLRQARDKNAKEQVANPDRGRRPSGVGRARRPSRARRL